MNKLIGDQLSAFLDDELEVREEAMVVSRLCSDEECREFLYRYSLIGSAVKSHKGDLLGAKLADRIRASISDEETHNQTLTSRLDGYLKPITGLAIAASVATIAVVSLSRMGNDVQVAQPGDVIAGETYIVPPVGGTTTGDAVPAARLTNYMLEHSEFSQPLVRRNVLYEIIGQDEKIVDADEGKAPEKTDEGDIKQ